MPRFTPLQMDVDARGFALTYLVREQTRLVDALDRATDLLHQVNHLASKA